jgi:hypothetical protein
MFNINAKEIQELRNHIDSQNYRLIQLRSDINRLEGLVLQATNTACTQAARVTHLEDYLKIKMEYSRITQRYVKTEE